MSDGETSAHPQLERLAGLYASRRFPEAINLALSITKKFPGEPLTYKILGAALAQSGNISKALDANIKLVSLTPHDHEAHINLGITLNELGRYNEAEKSFRTAIELEANSFLCYYNLGVTLKKVGRFEESIASYEKAVQLNPDFTSAHNNLASVLLELRRYNEAECSSRKAIALNQNYPLAHCNLGHALKGLGNLQESEQSYTRALTLRPNFEDALMGRWRLLFDAKDYESALRDSDRSMSRGSTANSLAALYALGRIEEIYDRLEAHSKADDTDISVAAFAAFISNTQGRNAPYNFCNNPLDFIYFSNLSNHIKNSSHFIFELTEEITKMPTVWEPSGKTTQKGFQSPQGMNIFEKSNVMLDRLKAVIFEELDTYLLKYKNHTCSYISKWPTEYEIFGWHVVLKSQGHQKAHIHKSGWLSGVIYLKVVPCLEENEGAIEFSLNGETYTADNSAKLVYQPELGDLVFFPSCLHHKTIPFTTDTDRIIIAFDLKPDYLS